MSVVRSAPNAFSNCRCACTHPFVAARKRARHLTDCGKHVPLLRNSALTQSITARTQAARRRSRWAMIRYSAVIWGTAGLRSGDVTTGDLEVGDA